MLHVEVGERKQPVVNLPQYFFLIVSDKICTSWRTRHWFSWAVCFWSKYKFQHISLLFPYSTFLCPAGHQSVALSFIHLWSEIHSPRGFSAEKPAEWSNRWTMLWTVICIAASAHRIQFASQMCNPYNVKRNTSSKYAGTLAIWNLKLFYLLDVNFKPTRHLCLW